jgi:hypothetical protein
MMVGAGTNKPSTSAAGDRPLPHTAPHKLLAQVEHPAGRSRMLVAVHGLAVRSASDAIRAPLTELLKPRCELRGGARQPYVIAVNLNADSFGRGATIASHGSDENDEEPFAAVEKSRNGFLGLRGMFGRRRGAARPRPKPAGSRGFAREHVRIARIRRRRA